MKHPLRAAAALIAAATLLTGCTGGKGSGTAKDASLDIATMTLPQSLDPVAAVGSALPYFQAVYDTLIKRNADGSYAPMLATAWTYDATRTQLTLTLRQGVTFDGGTPFDAKAVKANLERFQKGGGADAKTLAALKSVTVVDPTHVKLTLTRPDPAMIFYLSDSAGLMADPAAFAKGDALKTRPDGTGPYELDQARSAIGTRWVFTRAKHYWGEHLPYDTITISYFDNETAIVNGLKTGQINAALLQDAGQQISAEADRRLKTTPQRFDFQGILLFDRGGVITPALKDVRVRQAINYAIDRPTMLKQIRHDRGEITDQVFGTASAAYDPSLDRAYPFDQAKARTLLAQAGYGGGFTLKLPRIPAIVSDALATSLQTDLKAVGITLQWDQVDASAVRKIFTDRAYSGMVMNIGQPAEDWLTIKDLVLPGTFNLFGTTDDTVKGLLAKIEPRSAADAKADLRALNDHLVKDAWFVPFYRMTYLHVSDGTVKITPQTGMAVPSIYGYAPAK
ncbi:ABC transporter substrate-binding protein [Actinomadura gamaensis]|uniref:ABC transporter substrate-binding protein n=1 Tax=Actinomadura gamaensis TaxID=1763541 RepID=A0ABV9TUD9_9ACTN